LDGLALELLFINLEIVWIGGKIITMETKQLLNVIIGFLGLSIFVWLFFFALKDILANENAKRKIIHNAIIIAICLIYSIRIIIKDLFPILK
jgi:hypothetical protein